MQNISLNIPSRPMVFRGAGRSPGPPWRGLVAIVHAHKQVVHMKG